MDDNVASDALWLDHLAHLCRRLHPDAGVIDGAGPAAAGARRGLEPVTQRERGAAWVAVRDGLLRFLRSQSGRFGGVAPEDLEDLASQKALELVARAESGEWSIHGRSQGELAGYLATVARHALIDLVKQRNRMVTPADSQGAAEALEPHAVSASVTHVEADGPIRAGEFIETLRGCLLSLQPRARRIWFFRVFYGMGSRAIARHPAIALQAPHVDVIMQRTRAGIRTCMERKGFEPNDLPRGSFTALWSFLESLREETAPGNDPKAVSE